MLDFFHGFCLKTLGSLGDGEFDRFAFVQRAISFRLNGGVMDEDIIPGRPLDEAIALRIVKPLHYALFSIHIDSVFL